MIVRVDLRLEEYAGSVTVLAVFEDENYLRSNEREIYTERQGYSQIERTWYRKYTRPATYKEAKSIIEALGELYSDIQFCTIDWQAHSKRLRKEAKRNERTTEDS